jgi:hypothetical protein
MKIKMKKSFLCLQRRGKSKLKMIKKICMIHKLVELLAVGMLDRILRKDVIFSDYLFIFYI